MAIENVNPVTTWDDVRRFLQYAPEILLKQKAVFSLVGESSEDTFRIKAMRLVMDEDNVIDEYHDGSIDEETYHDLMVGQLVASPLNPEGHGGSM